MHSLQRKMDQISFQYPIHYLFFGLLLAIGVGFLLYFKTRQFFDRPDRDKFMLAILRTSVVFLLFVLLMNPMIKRFNQEIKKPVITLAIDQSRSMIQRDSTWVKDFTENLNRFESKISEKYEIQKIGFGKNARTIKEFAFSELSTDLGNSMDYISEQMDPLYLKGIVLFSDGIYNTGKNPLYHPLTGLVPVYGIIHGDSTQEKDLSIQRVYHNDIIYSGDNFSIQIDIQAWQCDPSKYSFKLSRLENNNWIIISDQSETIEKSNYFITKNLVSTSEKPGIYKYRIQCSHINGEKNLLNNSKEFYVEVLDSRKKVLILAHSPHPDISAIKESLESNKNYEVKIKYPKDPIEKMEELSLVIFHQLPNFSYDLTGILSRLDALKVSRIFIIGQQTEISLFNQKQDLLKINASNKSSNESQAIYSELFNSFTIDPATLLSLSRYPPLITAFGNYQLDPTANVMLYQRIGKVDTKYPLWVFGERGGIKTSIICGEGLWKWKLNDYIQNNNFNSFHELLSKSLQYTSTKEDRRKFRISLNKRVFSESDQIIFNAELYNDNYERINKPDVFLKLTSSDNKTYDFTFGKKENFYELNAGSLPEGEYKFIGNCQWNNLKLNSEGRLNIQSNQLEFTNLVARPDLLRGLAEKSGGSVYQKNQMDDLANLLMRDEKSKPIIFQTLDIKPLIDRKWIFFLLFLMLGLEWFFRRYWGSY
ncbi:MAG: VWA domain-containing protein [Saprospiraceae bacterium]|nr:VWA domain-containing protein [Candidatus Vicinibacter affinis]